MHPFQCALCGHDNPLNAKFCNECGSPLHLALCACGAINEVADAQCYKCGAPLEPARAAVPSTDLDDRIGRVEARLQALERDLKDPVQPAHARAPSGALVGNRNPSSAPKQAFGSSERPEGDSPPTGARPSEGEPRAFMGKPAGPGAPATTLTIRQPRFAAIAIVMAVALAAAGGTYLRHLQESVNGPTATAAPTTAGVAPLAEGVGTTSSIEAKRPPLDETPQVSSNVGGADAEGTAALPVSPTASAQQPSPPSTALGAEPEAPSPPATANAEVSDQRCPAYVAAISLCDRMTSSAGQ